MHEFLYIWNRKINIRILLPKMPFWIPMGELSEIPWEKNLFKG